MSIEYEAKLTVKYGMNEGSYLSTVSVLTSGKKQYVQFDFRWIDKKDVIYSVYIDVKDMKELGEWINSMRVTE